MNRDLLIEQLCAGHCAFYRADKDEELACQGFIVLQKLLELRHEIPAVVEKRSLQQDTEDELFRSVCTTCPFFAGDCDYSEWRTGVSSELPQKDINPCGGFLFLGYCIDQGNLDIRAIDGVI